MVQNYALPRVSVIIPNLNGREYLKDCLDSLYVLNYDLDQIEIIVVDNGSTDGSVEFVQKSYPQVMLIPNKENIGFAPANNLGARQAWGEYVAFLNNDTRVDADWLKELVDAIYLDDEVVCCGSRVLSWDGKTIDFVGSMLNFEGKGFQIDYGKPVREGEHDVPRYYLFVNGGAMLVRRDVFLDVGGFDEDFFAYYEDVDFGWRLWVMGYKVLWNPKSVVYHRHHGTSDRFGGEKRRFHMEQNALYAIYKNYDDDNLGRILASSLLTQLNRVFVSSDLSPESYRFNYKGEVQDYERIPREAASSLMAAREFIINLDRLMVKRQQVQSRRKRSDKTILNYFKGEFLAISPSPEYQEAQIKILKALGIYDVFSKEGRQNLLILAKENIGRQLAGPGMRVWNLASVLSEYANVKLAVPGKVEVKSTEFEVVSYDKESLRDLAYAADIIYAGGTTFVFHPVLKEINKPLIIDIYDPFNLSSLIEYRDHPMDEQLKTNTSVRDAINQQLYYGDFFICASEKQRDYWLGMLSALGRVNPYTFGEDPTLRKLIDVVPFGLPTKRPLHSRRALKGVVPGIEADDFVLLWGGGIYNWLDPRVLIKAMTKIWEIRPDIKLFFLGVKHPNPQVKELAMVNETVSLAKSLGIYEKNVFLNFGWVEYEDRQNYLLESDVGVISHPEHIETRFAFRTRVLDYIWAHLPIITTKGDSLSDLVEEEGLGLAVKETDVEAMVEAILRMASDKEFYQSCVQNLERVEPCFRWNEVSKPLIRFLQDPRISASKKKHLASGQEEIPRPMAKVGQRKGFSYYVRRLFYHLRRSGWRKTGEYVANVVRGR
ncbi:rhamnosyltransferase [Candidatus Hakubella thermalkaliphila]|uniref:Rhamnosyltransferase n=1 Tax=Candidatus Hakubella thermalkaliphila TaxID=2754717 RepID=A0A6V8PWE6_9ACTN|nr:glycosyltransferase [Candidatus Hakubella thermalkaliphila]GFP29558.1 rhamnosyltransferase [Candidatus Hakubella thermalkaliphila]GFP36899.1 rhamnosyltransferase [Candidatus Hakubella thermalkaliphila]GFP42785.1 rhamnosyltransferase [Candidatus Hakubella thermalkaliphila]